MPAKLVLGYSFASRVRSSVKMKPTPITRSMPSAASSRKPASRSDPSPGSMKRTCAAELPLGALAAEVGAVVERLVAAAADVEDDADIHRRRARRLLGAPRPREEEGDVHDEEHADEHQQSSHGAGRCGAGQLLSPADDI